jgi:hypothetical protein
LIFHTSLTAINVDPGNTAYTSENGVLYNKAKTILYTYPAGKADTSFTIPNSVTNVTFEGTIPSYGLNSNAFGPSGTAGYIGDLRAKYLAGGIGNVYEGKRQNNVDETVRVRENSQNGAFCPTFDKKSPFSELINSNDGVKK